MKKIQKSLRLTQETWDNLETLAQNYQVPTATIVTWLVRDKQRLIESLQIALDKLSEPYKK